jgi:hypothetical protein
VGREEEIKKASDGQEGRNMWEEKILNEAEPFYEKGIISQKLLAVLGIGLMRFWTMLKGPIRCTFLIT